MEKELEFPLHNLQRHVLVKIISEKAKAGKSPESVLVIITDVTLLKEKEKEVIAQKNNLESANKTLDNLIHTIAHDLRSPVANMKMIAALFEKPGGKADHEKFIQVLSQSVYQLDEKLAGLIKIVESQFNIQKIAEDVSFQGVLGKINEEIKTILNGVNAKISTDFREEKLHYIEAYLHSIMQNLISNAVKYRQKDKQLKIELNTIKTKGFTLLSVRDNGIGIDLKKNKNQLFEPFKRFSDAEEGKGIGLHIIKTMVERNGGRIVIESTPGEGAIFKVYLKEYQKNGQ